MFLHGGFCGVRLYEVRDTSKIDSLDWFGLNLDDQCCLNERPWSCRDGDIVLFKDNREKKRAKTNTSPEGGGSEGKGVNKSGKKQPAARVEAGIRFYTAEEAAERQKEQVLFFY